jgi:hypothetical protein
MPTDEVLFLSSKERKEKHALYTGTIHTIMDRLGGREHPFATETWKLIKFYDYEKVELYNLKNDPSESKDLSKQNPDKTQKLENKLIAWQNRLNAKLPTPNPDYKK